MTKKLILSVRHCIRINKTAICINQNITSYRTVLSAGLLKNNRDYSLYEVYIIKIFAYCFNVNIISPFCWCLNLPTLLVKKM